MNELAIYDMDRTITRTGTYTPFLIHAARRLAPWRLALAPAVPVAMLAYAAKLIDRKTLKQENRAEKKEFRKDKREEKRELRQENRKDRRD